MPDYGNPGYWDDRYTNDGESSFDWYQGYETLKPWLEPFLQKRTDFEILIPGCGNSKLGPDLYEDGYTNITNIDTSTVAISQLAERYNDRDEMEFSVVDVCNMSFFPAASFDLVIDKGLLDTLLCYEDNLDAVASMLMEVSRVLKRGGMFLIVSHGQPGTRLGYLNKSYGWSVEYVEIPKPALDVQEAEGLVETCACHFMYVCRLPKD